MMNYNTLGSVPNATIDPSNQRALETLFTLISDVEQRLQIVKASLTQTMPGVTNPTALLNAYGLVPQTSLVPPHLTSNGWPTVIATPYGNIPVFLPTPTTTTTPFVTPGLGTPLAFAGTPFGNFRF